WRHQATFVPGEGRDNGLIAKESLLIGLHFGPHTRLRLRPLKRLIEVEGAQMLFWRISLHSANFNKWTLPLLQLHPLGKALDNSRGVAFAGRFRLAREIAIRARSGRNTLTHITTSDTQTVSQAIHTKFLSR